MYHIKKDRRSIRSAKIISEGVATALDTYQYSEINISLVCKITGVSRSTFYRLFDTLDDVLLYLFDDLFRQSIDKFVNSSKHTESFAESLLTVAMNNKPLVKTIIKSGRMDLFTHVSLANERELVKQNDVKVTNQDLLFVTPMLNQMALVVLKVWVNNGCIESPKELYAIMKHELLLISHTI